MNLKLLFAVVTALGLQVAQAAELDSTYVKLFNMQLAMAKTGKPGDLYNLGRMYEQGMGTEQDLDKAHDLYSKAATKGEPRAKHKLRVWEEAEKEIADSLEISRPDNRPVRVSQAERAPKSASKSVTKKAPVVDRKRLAWKRAMAAALKRAEEGELGW